MMGTRMLSAFWCHGPAVLQTSRAAYSNKAMLCRSVIRYDGPVQPLIYPSQNCCSKFCTMVKGEKSRKTVEENSTNNSSVVRSTKIGKGISKNRREGENSDLSKENSSGLQRSNVQNIDLSQLKPAPPPWAYNLAAYVPKSETLSNLVKLGVDLHKLERDPKIGNMLMRLDFEKDVQPVLLFLHKIGVTDEHIGNFLTRFPQIFREDLDNMQIRVNYFESKRFSKTAIAEIMTKHPAVLSCSTKQVDLQLGVLQKDFGLKGAEVREAVTKLPKLITWPIQRIKDNTFALKEFVGFSQEEMKKMLLLQPKLYISDKHKVAERFNYLCEEMDVDQSLMVSWPWIFRTRIHIIRERHQFLKFLGRDQFDPTKENYVSLQALVTGKDSDFCEKIAKVPVQDYNDFLKTL